MTSGELTTGCIGFFLGLFMLDIWCMFVYGANLFTEMKANLDQARAPSTDDEPVLLPPGELSSPSAAMPNFSVVNDDEVKGVSPDSSAVFALEEGPSGRQTSVVCGIKTVPASEDISVMIIGFGYPKQEHTMLLYNYMGEAFGSVDVADALYVRIVKKDKVNK